MMPFCRCGFPSVQCMVTFQNESRPFYCCPKPPGQQCGFFECIDEQKALQEPQTKRPTSSSTAPAPFCFCNILANRFVTKKDSCNKGRAFYRCAKPQGQQCNFFQFEDELSVAESGAAYQPIGEAMPVASQTLCRCGLQAARRTVKKEGANHGRSFYCCPQPKDKDCRFFRFEDDHPVAELGAICQPTSVTQAVVPQTLCRCGSQVARRTVKKEGANKGRSFLCCPQPKGNDCDFFQFEDLHAAPVSNMDMAQSTCQSTRQSVDPTEVEQCAQGAQFALRCQCGTAAARRIVKKDGANKGRAFYCCAKPQANQCSFFQFEDHAISTQMQQPNVKHLPPTVGQKEVCSCGVLAVRRIVKKEGANKGRAFLCCAQPREQQCGFFQFEGEAKTPRSTPRGHTQELPADMCMPGLSMDDIRRQSRSIFQGEKVLSSGAITSLDRTSNGGFRAHVRGSAEATYSVEVPWLARPAKPTASCTCADFQQRGALCKHGSAVLMALVPRYECAATGMAIQHSSREALGDNARAHFGSNKNQHAYTLEERAFAGFALMDALKAKYGKTPYSDTLGPAGTIYPTQLDFFTYDNDGRWVPDENVAPAIFTFDVVKQHECCGKALLGDAVLDRTQWLEDHCPMAYKTAFFIESSKGGFYIYYPAAHRGKPPPNLEKYGLLDAPPGPGPGTNSTCPSFRFMNYSQPYEVSGKYRLDKNMVTLLGTTYAKHVDAYAKAYKAEECGGEVSKKMKLSKLGLGGDVDSQMATFAGRTKLKRKLSSVGVVGSVIAPAAALQAKRRRVCASVAMKVSSDTSALAEPQHHLQQNQYEIPGHDEDRSTESFSHIALASTPTPSSRPLDQPIDPPFSATPPSLKATSLTPQTPPKMSKQISKRRTNSIDLFADSAHPEEICKFPIRYTDSPNRKPALKEEAFAVAMQTVPSEPVSDEKCFAGNTNPSLSITATSTTFASTNDARSHSMNRHESRGPSSPVEDEDTQIRINKDTGHSLSHITCGNPQAAPSSAHDPQNATREAGKDSHNRLPESAGHAQNTGETSVPLEKDSRQSQNFKAFKDACGETFQSFNCSDKDVPSLGIREVLAEDLRGEPVRNAEASQNFRSSKDSCSLPIVSVFDLFDTLTD